jgi:hypothetical protein
MQVFSSLTEQLRQTRRELRLLKEQIGLAAGVDSEVLSPEYCHDLIEQLMEFQQGIARVLDMEKEDPVDCLGIVDALQDWANKLFAKVKAIRPMEEGEKFGPSDYIDYVVDVLVHHLRAYQEELAEDTRLRQEAREEWARATDEDIAKLS